MKDWLEKLDEMLKINDLPVLQSKGSISHEDMEKYVKKEMEKYRNNKLLEEKG